MAPPVASVDYCQPLDFAVEKEVSHFATLLLVLGPAAVLLDAYSGRSVVFASRAAEEKAFVVSYLDYLETDRVPVMLEVQEAC